MKKLLFAALALFIVNGAVAQIKVGVKAGGNLSNVTNLSNTKVKFGFHGGAFAEFVITDKFSIQPELLYSSQGYDIEDSKWSYTFGYINVPVLLKVNITQNFSAEFGPQIGILLSADRKTDNSSLSRKEYCNSIDAAAVASVSYTFAEKFVVNARYNVGITEVFNDKARGVIFNGSKDVKPKNSVIQLSFGYKFN